MEKLLSPFQIVSNASIIKGLAGYCIKECVPIAGSDAFFNADADFKIVLRK
jgi:hypothetical protein